MRILEECLALKGDREGDGARRKNQLEKRVRFTKSIMTQMSRTKEESQFNHYSGANEVSSVAFVDDYQWRINHRQCNELRVVFSRVVNPE